MKDKYIVMDLMKQVLSLSIYEREGYDYKVAVIRYNSKRCDIYYLVDGRYEFLSGLGCRDGSDLTEKEIMSHVALLFE